MFYVFVIYGFFLYSSFEKQLADVFLFFGFNKSFLAVTAVVGGPLQGCHQFAFDAEGFFVRYIIQQMGDAKCETFLFIRAMKYGQDSL